MHPASSNSSTLLNKVILNIEQSAPGLQVVAVRDWHYPLEKIKIIYQISQLRKCTLLEEFIFKASQIDNTGEVTVDVISDLLGLDDVFINFCVDSMKSKNILDKDRLPAIRFVDSAIQVLKKNYMPEQVSIEELDFIIDRRFDCLYKEISENQDVPVFPMMSALIHDVPLKKLEISRKYTLEVAEKIGKVIEDPASGRRIVSIINVHITEKTQTRMSEFRVFNYATNQFSCKIWDHALNQFNNGLEDIVNIYGQEDEFCLLRNKTDPHLYNELSATFNELHTKLSLVSKKKSIQIDRSASFNLMMVKHMQSAKKQIVLSISISDFLLLKRQMIQTFTHMSNKNLPIWIGIHPADDVGSNYDQMAKIDEVRSELLTIVNSIGIPIVSTLLLDNDVGNLIMIDQEQIMLDSARWFSIDDRFNPILDCAIVISTPEIVNKYHKHIVDMMKRNIMTGVFKADNIRLILANLYQLQELSNTTELDNVMQKLVENFIHQVNWDAISQLAGFCIVYNKHVSEAVQCFELMNQDATNTTNRLKLLAYLRKHQPADYEQIVCKGDEKTQELIETLEAESDDEQDSEVMFQFC